MAAVSTQTPLGLHSFQDPSKAALSDEQTAKATNCFIEPFVTAEDVRHHLLIMSVFHKTHHRIDKGGIRVDNITQLPIPTEAEIVALARAEHRFQLWLSKIVATPQRLAGEVVPLEKDEMPPIDVLLILHAYLLSPWNFYEDCCIHYPHLEAIGGFPLQNMITMINKETKEYISDADQMARWEQLTGEPFATPYETNSAEEVALKCPHCSTIMSVPWISSDNSGYGEIEFRISCTSCKKTVTNEVLRVARLIGDVKMVLSGEGVLGHTLLSPNGIADQSASKMISDSIAQALDEFLSIDKTLDVIKERLVNVLGGSKEWDRRIDYVMAAYAQRNAFALDLGLAVLRQARYLDQMHVLHWCCQDCVDPFKGNFSDVEAAVRRYSQFLALNPTGMVPPEDIDIVFHTHQLRGGIFREQIVSLLGRFLNHDDSPENQTIVSTLERSIKLWEEHYNGAPYIPDFILNSACASGCSVTGAQTGIFYPGE